ncbi:hypothetical protein F4808DRAFT_336682 [Astrocystis sublimbata]|nr:hypothetical protein F4808DRAFT_101753 [Astrocystis sublimbata]KAI0194648.1 hypothetical protein F4808DRAFT_336682 [Astrocystis sublimbata]
MASSYSNARNTQHIPPTSQNITSSTQLDQNSVAGAQDGSETTQDGIDTSHKAQRPSVRRSLLRWKWELSWLCLSFASLATSIILLTTQNGRRVDSWRVFFTLNTFISILAQISRTALAFGISSSLGQTKWNMFSNRSDNLALFDAFDQASKGPWGSVRLTWLLKLRHLATLGAGLTIALLGFEPFLQATIAQFGKLSDNNTTPRVEAVIARTNRLDVGNMTQRSNNDNPLLNEMAPEWSFQAGYGLTSAIYNGFYASTSQAILPSFTCPTGNCTFGAFTSLGVCSACDDVSSAIVRSPGHGRIPGTTVSQPSHDASFPFTSYTLPASAAFYPNIVNLTLSNYNGLRNTTDGAGTYAGSGAQIFSSDTLTTAQATSYPELSFHLRNITNGTTFVVFQILQAHPNFVNNVSDWKDTFPVATECRLYFCTQVYTSSVIQGTLNETRLETWSNREPRSFQAMRPQRETREIVIDNDGSLARLYNGLRDWQRTDLQLYIPESDAARLGLDEHQPRRFNVSQSAVQATMNWIATQFAPGQLHYPNTATFDSNTTGIADDGPAQVIGQSKNLSETFDAVANTISVYIRSTGLETTPHTGTSQTWVLYYRIRWAFLAPPLVVVLVGCGFLLYTIWETHSLGLIAWKDSTLATLAHGLDTLTKARLRDAFRDDAEDKCAREITISVEKSWGGFGLTESGPGYSS